MSSSTRACLFLIVLVMILSTAKARFLELNPTEPLNDGVHENRHKTAPFLIMVVSDSGRCETIYGVFPCANTTLEGLFLTVVYAYVMMLGEDWLKKGSAALLLLFGDDVKVAGSVFRILLALPRVLMVIVSGVNSTESDARNQVASGFAMYAGSTVITLTGIWGVNVILGTEKFRKPAAQVSSLSSQIKERFSVLTDYGVSITNKDTQVMALIMLLSLIPFAVVLLVRVFNSRVMILVALVVSVLSLFSYIAYQIASPWIQNRSLAYLKEHYFQKIFLKKLQDLTSESLYDGDGNPNLDAIRSIFDSVDQNKDRCIKLDELEDLILKKLKIEEDEIQKEYAKAEILRYFHINENETIYSQEFMEGCSRWLRKMSVANEQNPVKKFLMDNGIDELAKIERVMPRILFRLLKKYKIVKDNGEIDENEIDKLLSIYDEDKDGRINFDELEHAIPSMNLDANLEIIATGIMSEFDVSHSGKISKDEFIRGLKIWIERATTASGSKDVNTAIRLLAMDAWDTTNPKEESKIKILYALLGIATIYLFASPFTQTVIESSNALNIPFLFTSFVVVPFFMNARSMVIFVFSPESRQTSQKDPSSTFFELYGGLVMNNLMGLTTLLTIVYIKGLTWVYTAEVATIIVIGVIMGLFVRIHHIYPLWTSIASFILYGVAISLFCVYTWDRA